MISGMAETTWGNPATKAFTKQQLRYATHGDAKVHVNKLIWKLVNRILIGLDQAGFNANMAQTNEDDPLRISFKVQADDVVMVNQMIEPAKFLFMDNIIRFTGTPAEAESMSASLPDVETLVNDVADSDPVDDIDPETVPELPPEARIQLGHTFTVGDEGDDVQFVQYLIGLPVGAPFSHQDSASLAQWQKRHWLEPTGVFDEETLHQILPKRMKWIRPGATGDDIRALQAAFLVLGLQKSPVNGVWGIRFSQSLRAFQRQRGLMIRSRVSLTEWESIFITDQDVVTPL